MPFSILKVLESVCSRVAVVAALLMALIIVLDVLGRNLFKVSLGFSYEVVSILLAVMFYSGLYHVHKTRSHVTIDLLDRYFVGSFGRFIYWMVYLIECTFFTALVVTVFIQSYESYKFGDVFLFLGVLKWKVILVIAVLALIAWVSLLVAAPAHHLQEDSLQEDSL
ncbi:hypothetical protein GCM10011352_08600 [Marinobacterium zhoushanense]|uniref:TRAP transporter small permease protein n=1 Tax=Marinobacterium zhoushanense TaxID=1679163 RepID=A0ABQ1K2Z6_9GAMM|nr:TRAP transporter small permease subunit [Marinobacterium zhoushanense]GGB85061.1 hypothetical protein GCM10011352_08600 [Marinobacterium zhoushanense]